MPVKLPPPRVRFLHYLRQQLKSLGKLPGDSVIRALLTQAAEGLVALDYGEAQPIYAPGSTSGAKDGTKPYTLRKLRMRALGYADLLIANNYKGEEAVIRTVANAYGQKANTFRQWRKNPRLGKTTDPLMKSFREDIAKLSWDEAKILVELKKAGDVFIHQVQEAHKKKGGKGQKTKGGKK
jgi:hypothetical protein